MDDLFKLGADDVIPEEFETSLEIFSRVLSQYQTPGNVISDFVNMIRKDGYRVLRQAGFSTRKHLLEKYAVFSHVDIETFTIHPNSPVISKSIKDIGFRTKTGATIIAIERYNQIHTIVDPEFTFKVGDIVFITGKKDDIKRAVNYLTKGTI